MAKSQYKTKQMKEIMNYLETVKGQHVTVNDICGHFADNGVTIGTTTIYRHLEKMVQEGIVAKYIVDGSTSACFEYIDNGGCHDNSYHCKCEKCGKLIHLHCNEVENLKKHMLEHHSFTMNPTRTVFYGICSECRDK